MYLILVNIARIHVTVRENRIQNMWAFIKFWSKMWFSVTWLEYNMFGENCSDRKVHNLINTRVTQNSIHKLIMKGSGSILFKYCQLSGFANHFNVSIWYLRWLTEHCRMSDHSFGFVYFRPKLRLRPKIISFSWNGVFYSSVQANVPKTVILLEYSMCA